MIGIVVVSHSPALAASAIELALQMGADSPPRIESAAGAAGGALGTDAAAVAQAIERADSGDGVLVVMDLGSALLSAEMALELLSEPHRVVLSDAPFVEGLVSAVAMASGTAEIDLDDVAREASRALHAKAGMLGTADEDPLSGSGAGEAGDAVATARYEGVITNPSGLHARPAASFARAAGRFDADVLVSDIDGDGRAVAGRSMVALMSLGARTGTRIRVTATGPDAQAAVRALGALIDDGLGEN